MNRIYLFLAAALLLCFTTCRKKQKDTVTTVAEAAVEDQGTISVDFRGIWGDLSYLENLKKYNSVLEANKQAKFYTDLKLDSHNGYGLTPADSCTTKLELSAYSMKTSGDTLYMQEKETMQRYTYIKLLPIPNYYSADELTARKFNALNILRCRWFSGKYRMLNAKKEFVKELIFNSKGQVQGLAYSYYALDADTKHDYIGFYTEEGDDIIREVLMMEYRDGLYYCYNGYLYDEKDKEVVSLAKRELKYILQKAL